MSSRGQVIEADLTWTGVTFERGIQIVIDPAGRIAQTGRLELVPDRRLSNAALLPGFVSGHSHAFQRGLRGRGETFPAGVGSFWSWREAMYELVGEIDSHRFYRLTLGTFREMLRSGITTVGEFHYFHHSGPILNAHTPAVIDFAYDELVLKAAAEAGIRLVLLTVFYNTGGIGQPLTGAQRRFDSPSLRIFWEQFDRLQKELDHSTQSLGVAAHSIRGARLDDIVALHQESVRRGVPFHMHVEEQRKEIADSVAAYGKSPLELLNDRLEIDHRFTAVHSTHSTTTQLAKLRSRGGNICITPLTEANLGDGIPEVMMLDGVSLGTDSNARISMFEEMRWLEYAQRLKHEKRGFFAGENGKLGTVLLRSATENGARCLGVDAGRIAPGSWADFCVVATDHPSLDGFTESTLLDALIFGASEEVVAATCVGGNWIEHR